MEKLNELGLDNYVRIHNTIEDPNLQFNEKIKYLDKQIKYANKEKQRLNGSMAAAKNKYKTNNSEPELQMKIKNISNTRNILDKYIDNITER